MSFEGELEDEGPAYERYCSPCDLPALDDGTKGIVERIHNDIDRLDKECVGLILKTMGPFTPATDELLSKQTELAAAIAEREILLEKARCQKIVQEFEELHPPNTEECPICFEATRSFDVVSFPCCGKVACETCADPRKMECCPFCRGEVDEEEGAGEIARLAEKGNARFMRFMGVLAVQEGDTEGGMEWLEKALDNGLGAAADTLASIYQQMGQEDKARYYLKKAAESGYTPSQFKLAVVTMERIETTRSVADAKEVVKFLAVAASQGFPMAQLVLAKELALDKDEHLPGLSKSLDRSKYWLTRAIRSAPSDARFDVSEARVGLAQTMIELAEETYRTRHQVHGLRFADYAPGCSPYPMASVLLRLPGNGPAAKKLLSKWVEPLISDHCAGCGDKISNKPRKGGNKKKKKGKKKGKLSCPHCQGAYYCGKECLTGHWKKGHEKDCKEACSMKAY